MSLITCKKLRGGGIWFKVRSCEFLSGGRVSSRAVGGSSSSCRIGRAASLFTAFFNLHSPLSFILAVVFALGAATTAEAAIYWTGAKSAQWKDTGNWTGSSGYLYFNSDNTKNWNMEWSGNLTKFTYIASNYKSLYFSAGTPEKPFNLNGKGFYYNNSGGTSAQSILSLGGNTAALWFYNGTLKTKTFAATSMSAWLKLGNGSDATTLQNTSGNMSFSKGTFIADKATVTSAGVLTLGSVNLYFTNATTTASGLSLAVNADDICTADKTGGDWTLNGDMILGAASGSTATFTQNSGTVTVASGKWTKSTKGNGTLNLNGGTFVTQHIEDEAAGGSLTVNFNGGTIKANNAHTKGLLAHANGEGLNVNVDVKGGTIDTDGRDISIHVAVNAVENTSGPFTVTGEGSATFSAMGNLAGALTVGDNTTLRWFDQDGAVSLTCGFTSLALGAGSTVYLNGDATGVDALPATVTTSATSDNPATVNIDFSEMPNTGRTFNLFAVDDIAKLNIKPMFGSLAVPHSVSIKDGVAVLTITADDFVWNGTKPNWNDEGAWTKGAEGAKWTDGNNAVFSIHNSTAILDGSASVAELHFSANAEISAKEGEESPSLLTASNIIVDEGVTGSISAELAQDIEKTGSGTLELSRSREGKTTKVSDGTIKFTDGVDVGDLVLGTDVNKSVALDYSGNKLTGKINSYMNIATSSGGNATLKNGEYQYTETLRVWNGFLTIADDATVTMDSSANRWVCVGGNNADSESATDVDARLIIDGGSLTNNTGSHLGVGDFGSAPSKATMIVKNGGTYVGKSNAYIAQGAEGHLIVDGEGSSVTVSTLYFNGEARNEAGENGYVSVTNGGLIAVKGITRNKGNANGYFNFDGGTLKASASGTLIASHDKLFVNVNSEGGTIDNNGFDVTITEDLTGAGELTLAGEGTTTIAGKLEVGALKVSKGAKLAFSSLNADTAAAKASDFIFEDGSSIVLPKSLAMGSYKLFELSSGEFSSDVLANCSIEGIAIPYELKIEGNLINILIDKNYLLFKNKNTTSQEITGEVSFYGEGALDAETLTFTEKAKLILDPIKTPVYIWGSEEGKGFIFANGAKIALSPNYAGMTCGKITLMTFKSEYARNLPENLDDIFDASSIASGVEWSITLEDVPDASVYRKNLVLTVGDYENAPEIKILPIGDSITQGVTKDSQGDYPQYRTAIAARLAANGYKPKMVGVWKYAPKNAANVVMSEDWVWHCGISGDGIKTSPNTASSQRGGVRDNLHLYLDIAGYADVITLLIGTNDIGAGDAADEVYASFKALIENISAERPNAKIIGATLLDRNESTSENHQKIIAFNDLLKSDWAAKKLPSNFVLLDLYSMVPITSDNFFTDKLHLNWAGCSLTSEAFAEKIMEALPLSGENAFGGTQDDTVTDEAQVALGADVLVPETYRGGMERAFVIDAETPANVFTKDLPYTSVGASVSLGRKVKRAGYYMELVRAGTSRRRFVWVDFDAEGKTLDDIDFPWSGENMQFIAENMHVYSNDSSIKNVSPDKDGVKGIIEGTYHNYTAPDALEGAPKDIFGSSDTYGWNDTMGSGNAGHGCFQAHRIFSQEEGDAHWNDAQVLFAWNRWGSSTATDEIGIGDYACHANGVGNTMDYTWTSEKGTDGLPDTVTASAYQVRRLEIWASFEEETRPGVWTGAAGNNSLLDKNNWTGNTLPGTEDTVFIGVSDDVELVCDGAFAVNAIEISGDGKLKISGSGSIAVASSIIRMGASRPVVNVPVDFKSGDEYVAIDVTGEVDFQGGVKGTYPVNHTTFYGNYTLTASTWTLSSDIKLAANATLTATAMDMNTAGKLLDADAGAVLTIGQIHPKSGSSIFGAYAGKVVTDKIYPEGPGTFSLGSGFTGELRVKWIYYYGENNGTHFTVAPGDSSTMIIGGGNGITCKKGYIDIGGQTFKSSGDWSFDSIDNGNKNSGKVTIGSGITVDTSDVDDPTAPGHTVTVKQSASYYNYVLTGNGGVSVIGNGSFVFTKTAQFTGGLTASDSVTIGIDSGVYPGKGDVTIRDMATLKLVDSASGTVPVAGKLTMEGGSTLHVPQFSASVVPISVNSLEFVNVENNKKVALKIDSGSLINGYNVILESDNAIPENAWSMIDVDISADGVSIPEGMETSYVTQGNALCILVKGVNDCIWTGSGDASTFNNEANWRDGKIPSNGANLYIPASSDITIINDIENFSPASITFSAGSGSVTIDGEEAIKGIVAVTNLSSSVQEIACPLEFADNYRVHCSSKSVKFSGGATATYPASDMTDNAASRALTGNIMFTEDWTAVTPMSNKYTVPNGSRVYGKALIGSVENKTFLCVQNGGYAKFDSILTGKKLGRVSVQGELEVVNQWIAIATDNYSQIGEDNNSSETGVLRAGGLWKGDDKRDMSKILYIKIKELYIGKDGLGAKQNDYYLRFDHDDGHVIHATDDFEIFGPLNSNNPHDWGLHLNGRNITFDTAGHTVLWTAGAQGSNGKVVKTGEGTLVMNPHGTTLSCAWSVDEGMLALAKNNATGSGAITVNTGAVLEVPSSTNVALGGDLTLKNGACLGFNYTTRNPPVLNLTDRNVTFEEGESTNIVVKISSSNGKRPYGGVNVLTSGGKFSGVTVSKAADNPDWVKDIYVDDDGNIVLLAKPRGTRIIVR